MSYSLGNNMPSFPWSLFDKALTFCFGLYALVLLCVLCGRRMTYLLEAQFVAFLPAFMTSLVASILIVMTKQRHIHRTARVYALQAVQCSHRHPTPRIGGLAVLAGGIVAAYLFNGLYGDMLWLALLAASPVFLAGLLEDTGFRASPGSRLGAAMLSGGIMVLLTGQTIHSGVAPGIDLLLGFFAVSALFTVLVTAAICHAFNLVDGMNGLAIVISLMAVLSLALIAIAVGDYPVAAMAGGIGSAVLGVLFLNYPFGKLFLGDSGAYTVGFLIAWTGILLIARNPDVSNWAVLLTIFWPFMDTTEAVARRFLRNTSLAKPDRLHFHHLVMRMVKPSLRTEAHSYLANPLTTLLMLPLVAIPAILGVLTANDNQAAIVCLTLCILAYVVIRRSVVRSFQQSFHQGLVADER